MALMGLPSGSNGGDILSRIQYDAKAGKWHRVDRTQNASGEWVSDMVELDKGDMFLMDMPQIEVGWIAFASVREGNLEVYITGMQGGITYNLTRSPGQDRDPDW